MASGTGWPKTMRFDGSLRARFVVAVFALVFLICGGFYFAVYQFVEVLERQLMDTAVKRELNELVDAWRAGDGQPVPVLHSDGIRGFVWRHRAALPANFPEALLSWPSGRYDEIKIDGNVYYAGRQDLPDASLFLILDLTEIEDLEARLVNIAYGVIGTALLAAVLMGYWLSYLVMKPVSRLARHLAELKPENGNVRLGDQFGDREIGLIAAAVDRYQDRIAQFIGRERAFTDDASHELRTPLAVVLSAVPLLKDDTALSPLGLERLARLERAARQMHAMIEALLFLAREDGGWRSEPCALDEVMRDISDSFQQAAQEQGIDLVCHIVQPLTVQVPPGVAASVVGNLLSNALQHTRKGRVELRLESDRMVVQDTGIGIGVQEQLRIFERGYRGARSQGRGIGLYLVQRICERLDWTVHVHSAPGAGTRFDVVLPLAALTKI